MFKEKDIRPDKIFNQYLKLSNEDRFFFKKSKIYINCPSCNKKTLNKFLFIKHGHKYNLCKECSTIYVNPRPSLGQLMKYYKESKSANFFADTFYKKTKKNRIKLIWNTKVNAVHKFLKKKYDDYSIYDIGGGYGIFANLYNQKFKKKVCIIEPDKKMYDYCIKEKNLAINKFLENVNKKDLDKKKKVFVSFELFEHLQSPLSFLKNLRKLMNKGDIFIFTTLSGVGVDIKNLGKNSKSFSIQHLNFFNPTSIKTLLNKNDFKVHKIETPGELDIDILSKQSDQIENELIKNIIETLSENQKRILQKKISYKNLSSHMRVFCSV